jgi:outer membrane protein OmpA-like peptidoglycan-associated protein
MLSKKNLWLLIILMSPIVISAQDFLGIKQSDYGGIYSVDANPANIADSRYLFDINLGGFSTSAYNNYMSMQGSDLKGQLTGLLDTNQTTIFDDPDFLTKFVTRDLTNENNRVFIANEIYGPSFMFGLKGGTIGIGMSSKVRNIINVDGIGSTAAQLIYSGLEDTLLHFDPTSGIQPFTNEYVNAQAMTWAEWGVNFGMVAVDKGEHFFKWGARVFLIQGLQASYMYMKNVEFLSHTDSTISVFNSHVNYGHSNNYEIVEDGNGELQVNYFPFTSKKGFGLDFGGVYEWRPNHEEYRYDMDGETNLWRRDQNKYKVRAELSVKDIGRVNFDKGTTGGDFLADVDVWNLHSFDGVGGPDAILEIDSILNSTFGTANSNESSFKMNLPTTIRISGDYHIWHDLYLNAEAFFSLQFKKDETKIHNVSKYAITARYDHKWGGIAIPVSYGKLSGLRVGTGLRAGPFMFGTSDLSLLFKKGKVNGLDLYFGVHAGVPITKVKDKDEDKVSDKVEKKHRKELRKETGDKKDEGCGDVPGVWEFKGCPDSDGDHIEDSKDDCPYEAGPAKFNGCPDTDEDGIMDKLDSCVTIPGILKFSGCPDTDEDGIQDSKDKCPEVAGLEKFEGCPDRDGDGVQDSEDECPDDPGPVENLGCPDRDGDGIFDYLDECPDVAGPEENRGCPWPDTDGDGILDKDDDCPKNPGPKENNGCPYTDTDGDGVLDKDDDCVNVPGPVENKGCPKILEEEQEILNTAFENLEFKSGKDIILLDSYASLEDLGKLLVKKAEWKLLIGGHTDDVGKETTNMVLSKKRSLAVKAFLVERGIDESRFVVEWYGELKPIATNDTDEGRQKNRRVEMTILFE